jgi:colanic acid/amylovoran biosynthesis protein
MNWEVGTLNIFLEAFIDKNLGDDMMIETLVSRYPRVLFYALGPENYNDDRPYSDWNNLIIVNRQFWESYLSFFDGYVNIGGSVWQDYGDNQEWYRVRQITLQQMREQKKPRLMIGNNIGPITTKQGESFFENMMKDVDEITLRDITSFNWAKQRLREDQIRLTADLVFTQTLPEIKPNTANRVGFTIHRDIVYPEKNSQYLNNIARIISTLYDGNKDLLISLFAFDTGAAQNDLISISEMMESYLPQTLHNRVRIIAYDGNIRKIIGEIRKCHYLFASHFHAIVLALLMKIPFIPFSYQNKTVDFLNDLNYIGLQVDYDNLSVEVDQIVDNILYPRNLIDENAIKTMIQRSKTNFNRADQELRMSSAGSKNLLLQLIAQRNQKYLSEGESLQGQLQLSRDETIGTRQLLQIAQDEVTGTRQMLQSAQDEVTGTRQMLQAAQDEVTGTRQMLQAAQDEVTGTRQMLQAAQDEVTGTRQMLKAAQDEVTGTRQMLQAAQDEVTGIHQMLKAAQDEVTGIRQMLKAAQDEVTGIRQMLKAAQDEVTGTRQMLQVAQDEVTRTHQLYQTIQNEVVKHRAQLETVQIDLNQKEKLINELIIAGAVRQQENIQLSTQIAMLLTEIASIKNSLSWKITSPVRMMKRLF